MTSGILANITGVLHSDPSIRHTKANGNQFTACTVKYRDGDGNYAFMQATAFAGAAQDALADLHAGDGVSLTGYVKLGVWERDGHPPKPSMQMLIEGAQSLKVRPKTKASNDDTAKKSSKKDRVAPAATADVTDPDLNDDPSVLWAG